MTTSTKEKKQRINRIMNDLVESNFNTPEGLIFIRYGRRADADYKVSKNEAGMHLIEVRRGEEYHTKWVPSWDSAVRHLAYLCSKFKKTREARLLEEAKKESESEGRILAKENEYAHFSYEMNGETHHV